MLHKLSSFSFKLPFYIDERGRAKCSDADSIPFITWPDGRWCYPANVAMLELYQRGLSRKQRGGTLATVASHLSHLIRYCYSNDRDFIRLNDNDFTLFIRTLVGESKKGIEGARARGSNHVISIGRTCLEFLNTVGRIYQIADLVGPEGQIRAEHREATIKLANRSSGRGSIVRKYWHHHSFPVADPKQRRHPISSHAVKAILNAVAACSSSLFIRKRRYVMLKLLEVTGGRRSEVAALTVSSVYSAAAMAEPMLKLMTAKKRGGKEEYRYIPVSKHDISFLIEYIEKNRKRIIRATCGAENDDGFLLISETTGRKLQPNTLTQEMRTLSIAAGIKEQSCPHLFRHRFITKLFVALIEQHHFENPDSFRRALLDVEAIKQKIQQWTGHSSMASLDGYIDLAFEEMTNLKKTHNIVQSRLALDSFKTTVAQAKSELANGTPADEVAGRLAQQLDSLEDDLDRFAEPSA